MQKVRPVSSTAPAAEPNCPKCSSQEFCYRTEQIQFVKCMVISCVHCGAVLGIVPMPSK